MPLIHVDGRPLEAAPDQTVIAVLRAHGVELPHLCWHPALSVAGNCRLCVVQVEGRDWVEIACNMPATDGLRLHTDSALVRAHREATLRFLTLNHPVDCGICDKAGECRLQDYHVAHDGHPSTSHEPKVRLTKHVPLGRRIVLDNERCVLCTRCVRFTHEVSRSFALGVESRGDHSVIRAAGGARPPLDEDAYSDNIIDLCPVGALLSRDFLHQERVWMLQATPSICPGCERGCAIDVWHRKDEWFVRRLDAGRNVRLARVTARDDPAVNGPWVCNKARDLPALLARPRPPSALLRGRAVALDVALDEARARLARARRPVAWLSSWASNEELAAFEAAFAGASAAAAPMRLQRHVDHHPQPGEVVEDGLLIRADKNPNRAGLQARFGALPRASAQALPADADLLLAWGDGLDLDGLPAALPVIALLPFASTALQARADVVLPISLPTERDGSFTNVDGVHRPFTRCVAAPPGVAHAADLFAALARAPAEPAP